MPIEPVIHAPQTIRPPAEADRQRPDGGRSGREGRKRPASEPAQDEKNPTPNDRGQITGKLIDVTA